MTTDAAADSTSDPDSVDSLDSVEPIESAKAPAAELLESSPAPPPPPTRARIACSPSRVVNQVGNGSRVSSHSKFMRSIEYYIYGRFASVVFVAIPRQTQPTSSLLLYYARFTTVIFFFKTINFTTHPLVLHHPPTEPHQSATVLWREQRKAMLAERAKGSAERSLLPSHQRNQPNPSDAAVHARRPAAAMICE